MDLIHTSWSNIIQNKLCNEKNEMLIFTVKKSYVYAYLNENEKVYNISKHTKYFYHIIV